MSNGRATTNPTEQYQMGLEAGRNEMTKGLDAEAVSRRIRFDEQMAATSSPSGAAFHEGRIAAMTDTKATYGCTDCGHWSRNVAEAHAHTASAHKPFKALCADGYTRMFATQAEADAAAAGTV